MDFPIEKIMLRGATSIANMTAKFGVLDAIKSKLMSQPEVAAEKLYLLLVEMDKIYLAFESELVPLLAVNFMPIPDGVPDVGSADQYIQQHVAQNHRQDLAVLRMLAGDAARVRIAVMKTHCSKMCNLNRAYLSPWFQRVLGINADERRALNDLFQELCESDERIVVSTVSLAGMVSHVAQKALDHYNARRINEANETIVQFRAASLPVRRSLSKARFQLQELQAEFISLGHLT